MTLAGGLAGLFDYTNSYYHRFPRVDLLEPSQDLRGFFGFVMCSDVLEHVPPSADRALVNIADMLDSHGFAVISVPIGGATTPTHEYYPGLVDWREEFGHVVWRDENGIEHVDDDPEFHGGAGQTLAFRLWGGLDFCERFVNAGMRVVNEVLPCPELGVPPLENHGVYIAYK